MATATKQTPATARAARRAAAASVSPARFEPRPAADRPVDLAARREAAVAADEFDAERWLDEGGSFSTEAVERWRAR